MKISDALSSGHCVRCGELKSGRRVSVRFEYVCDPCARIILSFSAVLYVADFTYNWKTKVSSPAEIRQVIERRRRLLTKDTT